MSGTLTEERDRIERQIQVLEQNLGAAPVDLDLLSSDTSSDDGSDDEIQPVEPSHQVSTGLLAQRDQIQQEIEDLQNALVSQNAIGLSNDDSSSDNGESGGELDIPETEEGCLQVNLVYQQVLLDSLNQLEQLLNQNTRAQKELLFQMAGPTRDTTRDRQPTSYQQPAKKYLGRFLKPYFKDKLTGLGPPANSETRDRTNKMTTTLDDKRLQMKRWEGWQKTLLINAVSKDSLKRQIQPKQSKVNYLCQKMDSASASTEEKEALREQIGLLEKDIQLLRSQKEEEFIGGRYDEHDWQKISNIDFEGTREADDLSRFWQNFLHPSVNKSSWTPEELKRLEELSEEHGERNWESVAEELGTGRTAFMCFQTYQRHISKTLKRAAWSAEEDALLRELVEKMRIGNFIPYTQMSYFIDGRDPSQLMYRWAQVLDPSLRKGYWSEEEDKALLRAVARLGEKHWSKIRLEVPGRSDGACRDRYNDCLKAGIRRGAFDEQERDLLIQLVKKHGVGRWARIAAEIPNRHDAHCLREWKKFVKQDASRGVGKKRSAKTRAPARVRVKQEEEEEELEVEEENEEQVVYMDSDDEKMKDIVKEEKELEREDEEREQKKEQEEEKEEKEEKEPEGTPPGITVCPAPKMQGASFRYQVVERPSFGPVQCNELPVRSTLADASGHLLDTLVCLRPRVLSRSNWHSPLAMLQVSNSELYSFLLGCSTYMHSRPGGGGRSASQRRPRSAKSRLSRMSNVSMDYRLMAAVTLWIGNLLVPDPTWDRETGAYALRQRMQAVSLGSTPIFRLLLQVLNVDALGCKNVIERRQQKAQGPPLHLPSHKSKPNTVHSLLNQKHEKAQERKVQIEQILPQLRQFPPPHTLPAQAPRSPQIQWMLIPQVTPQSPSMPPNLHPHSSPGAPSNRYPIMHPVIPPQMAPIRLPPPTTFFPSHLRQLFPSSRQQSTGAALPYITTARSPGNALLLGQALASHSLTSAARPAEPASPSKPALAPPTAVAAPGSAEKRGAKRVRAKEPSSGPSPEVKRVRRMTVKGKALEETSQAKTEAKCKTSQKRTQNQIGQAGPVALPDGFLMTPGQSMWIMTPNGLVSLVGEPPQGLKIALPPRHQGPTPPRNVFLQPLCPPMLPTNTHHQFSSTNHQQSTNSMSIAPPSVSTTVHPPSVSTIQPPSVFPAIQPPSVSTIQPPSVSTAIQPPSVSTIQQASVSSTIQPPSVFTIQPPSVFPDIQPPSVSTAIQPPSVSTTIQPPSVSTAIQPPSVSTIQPPSVSTIQPPSVSTVQPPSVSTVQPPSVSTIQPPSVSTAIQQASVSSTIQPPSVSTIQQPSVSSTIQQASVSTAIQPQCVIASNQPPSAPSSVPFIPAPLSLHHQGLILPPHPPPLRREALQFDPALMFHEPSGEVQRWMSGAGGAVVPGLGVALPYLPPFVSSLETLQALLASKERLSNTAFQLLPPETPNPTPSPGPDHQYSRGSCGEADNPMDPDSRCEATAEANVAAVRKLVAKHCAVNPAYQMLKARFLSCFTVPALLATIQPIKETTENITVLQEGEGAPATRFTGIITHPLETEDTSS